ncbi:hypothetical protein BJ741DRAFT_572838 [Chytriomyces cf. hyalinus JEL632]|nr:hypothetical protein BJ741DRAFT_572838 [Chytriomyces cf. hyalinus JEL632]
MSETTAGRRRNKSSSPAVSDLTERNRLFQRAHQRKKRQYLAYLQDHCKALEERLQVGWDGSNGHFEATSADAHRPPLTLPSSTPADSQLNLSQFYPLSSTAPIRSYNRKTPKRTDNLKHSKKSIKNRLAQQARRARMREEIKALEMRIGALTSELPSSSHGASRSERPRQIDLECHKINPTKDPSTETHIFSPESASLPPVDHDATGAGETASSDAGHGLPTLANEIINSDTVAMKLHEKSRTGSGSSAPNYFWPPYPSHQPHYTDYVTGHPATHPWYYGNIHPDYSTYFWPYYPCAPSGNYYMLQRPPTGSTPYYQAGDWNYRDYCGNLHPAPTSNGFNL